MAEPNLQGAVYLHLFHGRDDPDQEMDDWGFRGPSLGPFRYVQTTYMCEIKFAMEREAFKEAFPDEDASHGDYDIASDVCWIDGGFSIRSDMVEYQGKFYGDWSVTASPKP